MLFAGKCDKVPDKKALRKKAGGWLHPPKGGEAVCESRYISGLLRSR